MRSLNLDQLRAIVEVVGARTLHGRRQGAQPHAAMITGCPHLAANFPPMILGTISATGPGGSGTTILIGRLG
jgi:hypothetical protein